MPGKPCTAALQGRESACSPWQRAESLQGSCPSLGNEAQQGLSSAQTHVRGAEAGAEGDLDLFRMVGVPVLPRLALPLCLLMDHRSLYGCSCWAKSLERYSTSSAPKSHTLHISCVRNPNTVPISAAGAIPIPCLWEAPSFLCPSAPAGGCSAASGSGPLQPSAGVSGARGCKVQGRAYQPHHRVQVAFGSSP